MIKVEYNTISGGIGFCTFDDHAAFGKFLQNRKDIKKIISIIYI